MIPVFGARVMAACLLLAMRLAIIEMRTIFEHLPLRDRIGSHQPVSPALRESPSVAVSVIAILSSESQPGHLMSLLVMRRHEMNAKHPVNRAAEIYLFVAPYESPYYHYDWHRRWLMSDRYNASKICACRDDSLPRILS